MQQQRTQVLAILDEIAANGFDDTIVDRAAKHLDKPARSAMASKRDVVRFIAEAVTGDLIEYVGYTALKDLTHPLDRLATGIRSCLQALKAHAAVAAFMRRFGYPAYRPGTIAYTIVERDVSRAFELELIPRFRIRTAMDFVAGPVFSMMARMTNDPPSDGEIDDLAHRILLALGVEDAQARKHASLPFELPPVDGSSLLQKGSVLEQIRQ